MGTVDHQLSLRIDNKRLNHIMFLFVTKVISKCNSI